MRAYAQNPSRFFLLCQISFVKFIFLEFLCDAQGAGMKACINADNMRKLKEKKRLDAFLKSILFDVRNFL